MTTATPQATKPKPEKSKGTATAPYTKSRNKAVLPLLSPAGLVLIAITVVPIGLLVYFSFTNFNQRSLFTGKYKMVGFQNYLATMQTADFWWATLRTFVFTTLMVGGTVLIGMIISQLLVRVGKVMRYTLTVVLILAWGMPNVASSLVWNWLFQPGYGVANWFITKLGIFGDFSDKAWDQSPVLAAIAILMLVIWGGVPFIAMTLYAAQTQIPEDYYEAARLDGASEFYIYRTITVKFLRPTLLLVTILSVIWDFNIFNQIWLVSKGGPDGATTTLGIYTFMKAFVSFDVGFGASISVITTLILIVLTSFYIRNLLRSGEDL